MARHLRTPYRSTRARSRKTDDIRFGQKLRRLRERAGISQSELARSVGPCATSKGYVSEMESVKEMPPAETIVRIADYFHVTTDCLLRDDIPARED